MYDLPQLPPAPALWYRQSQTSRRSGRGGYATMDSSLDSCSRCCRFLFLLVVIWSFVVSYMASISCAFLEYHLFPAILPPERDDRIPSSSPTSELLIALPFKNNTNTTDDDDDDTNDFKPNDDDTPVEDDDDDDDDDDAPEEIRIISTATFGLFRFTNPNEPDICYGYNFESRNDIPTHLQISR
jgi:hypothetical protein